MVLNLKSLGALVGLKSLGPLLGLANFLIVENRVVFDLAYKDIFEVHVVVFHMANFGADCKRDEGLQNDALGFRNGKVHAGLFKGIAGKIKNEIALAFMNLGRLLAYKMRNLRAQSLRHDFSNGRFIEKFIA